ncbi:MAG TPA: DUF6687 family protein [Acidimicrobiia bacterium]|nr:DUF6687 family protein [Acidimicrobiia bacterium]
MTFTGLPYAPYDDLRGTPHVVIDGAAQEGTVLTLSHWPNSATPDDLLADTSAEIVLRALDQQSRWGAAEAVTNNHPDQDGLMGIWAAVEPDAARARADLVVGVATSGDFAVVRDTASRRAEAAITALMDAAMAVDEDPYALALPRVLDVLDDTDRFEDLWRPAEEAWDVGNAALADGTVTITEDAALDLAVVTLAADVPVPAGPVLCTATPMVRMFVDHGDACEYHDRYETWVKYMSRPIPPRVDLRPLASALTSDEPGGAWWSYDGVAALGPALHVVSCRSGLDPATVLSRLRDALAAGPPAWDPYTPTRLGNEAKEAP